MNKAAVVALASLVCALGLPAAAVAQAPPPPFDPPPGPPLLATNPPPSPALAVPPTVTPPPGLPSGGRQPGYIPLTKKVRWRLKFGRHNYFFWITVDCIQDAWNIGPLRVYWRGRLLGKGQPWCYRGRARAEIVGRTVFSDDPFVFGSEVVAKMKHRRHMKIRVAARVDGKEYGKTLRLRRGKIVNPVVAMPAGTYPALTYWDRRHSGRVSCPGCWWYYFWSWRPSSQTWWMRAQEGMTNDNLGIFGSGYTHEWANHFYVFVYNRATGSWGQSYGPLFNWDAL